MFLKLNFRFKILLLEVAFFHINLNNHFETLLFNLYIHLDLDLFIYNQIFNIFIDSIVFCLVQLNLMI